MDASTEQPPPPDLPTAETNAPESPGGDAVDAIDTVVAIDALDGPGAEIPPPEVPPLEDTTAPGDTSTLPETSVVTDTSPPADVPCTRRECGLSCADPVVCGSCGNGVCDADESAATCPADCCDSARCDPASGALHPAGDGACAGAPDGTRCDDGDLANGLETCRAGRCRREPAACRCLAPGGAFPDPPPPPEEPVPAPEPTAPPWSGTPPTEPSFAASWALARIDLSRAWERTRGRPEVRVAIVDTGCDVSATDLVGQVLAQRDLLDGDDTAQDTTGHGTAMASIVAGRVDGVGVVGVAPGVRLLCARVADSLGRGTEANLAAGIRWAVSQGAQVILVGLGVARSSAEVEAAVAAAQAMDALVVAPSGSNGADHDRFPAGLPGVVSVAASSTTDLPSADSDLSPDTLLLAPGEMVLTASVGGQVLPQQGSSPAAALVAGVAALVRSADGALRAPQVRALLRATAEPVPFADFERVFSARRVNAARAVAAARAGRIDAAAGASGPRTNALPGEVVRLRARVENRGVTDLSSVTVTASASRGRLASGGAPPTTSASATVSGLPPGAEREVEFDLHPEPGQTTAMVTFRVSAPGDSEATNDTATTAVTFSAGIVHALRLGRVTLVPPRAAATSWVASVTVENAGNVPEGPTELRVGLVTEAAPTMYAVPALAPGARTTVTANVTPAARVQRQMVAAWLRPAPGQQDLSSSVAAFRVLLPPATEPAETAYFQLPGDNLIADTPWRTTRDRIPLMLFFARLSWVREELDSSMIPRRVPYSVHVDGVRVRNPNGPLTGFGPVVYQDRVSAVAPITPGAPTLLSTLVVRDEDGREVPSRKVLVTGTPPDGAHRIIWFPVEGLPNRTANALPDRAALGAFLEVDFRSWRRAVSLAFPQRTRKMLGVAIGEALPTLSSPGRADRYFDAHFHSIAEWYTGSDLTGPAKAYGGPLEMLLASAWSLGFVGGSFPPTWSAVPGQIITTDHNTYFGDVEAPLAGPSRPSRWAGATGDTGGAEMNLYRALVGRSAGEEVSLAGEGSVLGAMGLGRHTLLYDADRHVEGSWGSLASGGCTPTARNLLQGLAGRRATGCFGQDLAGTGGFTFAAHPFLNHFVWGEDLLRESLSLPAPAWSGTGHNTHLYVRATSPMDPDGQFVFRGYQFWNGRSAQTVTSSSGAWRQRDVNPWAHWLPTCTGEGGYRTDVDTGMDNFLRHVRDGLYLTFSDDPADPMARRRRIVRKVFMVAGSDAHGDFDYTLDLCASVASSLCQSLGANTVSDSAWGRPRTYTFGGTLEALRQGRSVVTDGPVLEAEIDAEGRGDWDRTTGYVAWHDNASDLVSWVQDPSGPARFDPDGWVGGGGRYDGEGSALVPVPWYPLSLTDPIDQRVLVRTRCQNIRDFGGTTPVLQELLLTGEGGTLGPTTRIALTPMACDGAWHVQAVNLPRPLFGPHAAVAHVRFGTTCPGTYEAYTNPIWLTAVVANIQVRALSDAAGNLTLNPMGAGSEGGPYGGLYFVQSLRDDPIQVRVMQLAADGTLRGLSGGVDGRGGLTGRVASSVFANRFGGRLSNTQIHIEGPSAMDTNRVSGTRRTDVSASRERFVMIVERAGAPDGDRRLRDAFDNPLGVLMVRFGPNALLGP
ncbi:MAG: S8 family serine peptidase [Deltaproteobacteria bacterium]|nr:S8 family serine peptidase [Deltaproteobacteria bacterium]